MKFRQAVTPDFIERIANVKAGRAVDYREDSESSEAVAEDYDGDFDAEI